MIKKITLLLSIVTLLGLLTACGTAINTTAEAVENATTVNTPTEETKEVNETPTPEPTSEPTEAPTSDELKDTEDASKEFDEDAAYEKIAKAVEAYDVLMNKNGSKDLESHVMCYETVGGNSLIGTSIETSDGFSLNDDNDLVSRSLIYDGLFTNYFYDYINNGGSYYDFAEYVSSHTKDDLIGLNSVMPTEIRESGFDTNNYVVWNVAWIPSLDGTLTIQNFTEDITVSSSKINSFDNKTVDVAYQCDIYMDDKDTGLKAVFDKDGNFLNFNDENAQIDMIIPFE